MADSNRDKLNRLEEERDSATRRMCMGITQAVEAFVDGEDVLPGLEYARKAALDFEQFVMGDGPIPLVLAHPLKETND